MQNFASFLIFSSCHKKFLRKVSSHFSPLHSRSIETEKWIFFTRNRCALHVAVLCQRSDYGLQFRPEVLKWFLHHILSTCEEMLQSMSVHLMDHAEEGATGRRHTRRSITFQDNQSVIPFPSATSSRQPATLQRSLLTTYFPSTTEEKDAPEEPPVALTTNPLGWAVFNPLPTRAKFNRESVRSAKSRRGYLHFETNIWKIIHLKKLKFVFASEFKTSYPKVVHIWCFFTCWWKTVFFSNIDFFIEKNFRSITRRHLQCLN